MTRVSFELVKSAPSNISFDWESFEADYGDDSNQYNQMKRYIEDKLIPAIHDLDYFSLAQNVKPKYRKYIENYLELDEKSEIKLQKLSASDSILVVDDINTSGATLDEILRKIRQLNKDCTIFIFTLIGRGA